MALQEALKVLTDQESDELIDNDHVLSLALERAQQEGIIFLDEIDKIALAGNLEVAVGKDPMSPWWCSKRPIANC